MTLQLRHIKKCQWNRGWYVQLTEWIKPITTSKLKFKWMCFPYGVPRCSLLTRGGWNTGDERQAHVSLSSRTDAKSHQAEAPEPSLHVSLLLQLLQGLQGLRFLLQVLRIPATATEILIYYAFYLTPRMTFWILFPMCCCATLFF